MADALSVVEQGWRGARECSLILRTRGIAVTHLVKGSLSAEVLAMIHPDALIRVIDVPRTVFRVRLWVLLAWRTLTKRVRWVLVDNDRTLRELGGWCRWCGLTPVFIRETTDGFELSVNRRVAEIAEVFGDQKA